MGKISFILILVISLYLAYSLLQNRDEAALNSELPKCADPNIVIKLPKYTVSGEQATISGVKPVNPPPGVQINENKLIPYRQILSGLPIENTLANIQKRDGKIVQVYPRSTQSKEKRWQKIEFPDGRKFAVYYPAGAGEVATKTNIISKYIHPGEANKTLYFADWGLIFLVHLNSDGTIVETQDGGKKYWITDVYQDTINYQPIPEDSGLFICTNSVREDYEADQKADTNKNTIRIKSTENDKVVSPWGVN